MLRSTSITFWGLRSRWTIFESWMNIRAFTISTTNLVRETKRWKIRQLTFCTSPLWDHTLKSPLLKRVLLPARIPSHQEKHVHTSRYLQILQDQETMFPLLVIVEHGHHPFPLHQREENLGLMLHLQKADNTEYIHRFFLTDPSSYKIASGWLLDFFILLSKKGDPASLNKNTL